MPAISPARLKKDMAQLFDELDDPGSFDRALEALFEFYADRTIRPSQAGRPATLLPAYHVPRPVIRELDVGLAAYASAAPDEAFQLSARMWQQGMYEYMLLAIHILSFLPASYTGPAVRRLSDWMLATQDETLLEEIFRVAGDRGPDTVIAAADQMLGSNNPALKVTALIGLAALAKRADESILPGIYKILGRLLENPSPGPSSQLLGLVRALALRSPAETAYFLRQYYLVSMRPDVARLLRQCLPLFPEPLREDLRKLLRDHAAAGGG